MDASVIGKNCPYCQTPIKPGAPVTVCTSCGMPHHADCWQENHGCTTFGCQGRPMISPGVVPAPAAATQPPLPALHPTPSGNLPCPTCGYLMEAMDITCPRCEYLRRQAASGAPQRPSRQQSVLPPPAPVYYPPAPQYYQQPGFLPATLPIEMRTWNWGAFFLTVFWAAAMNQWIWFVLCFIPYVNWLPAFYLAIKGNELSWQSRRWQSLEHFQATQEVWKKWGIGLFFAGLGIGLLIGIIAAISSSN
jgi:hypothetical protein